MLLSEKMDADSIGIPVASEARSLPFHYFATNDLIESAHVPLCELAQEKWACFSSQRVADGTAVHVRSPAQGSVSCHAILTDDQGAVSLSMDTGVVGLTSWRRVLSALSIAGGSLEVTRSQVVFHFHFYFLLCHRGAERLCRQR